MKTKLIKLIKNELIKIFKRKSIYILLLLSLIAVIRHNYSNPDQNPEYKVSTSKLPIMQLEEETIENVKINLKRKKHNDFAEIYNKYDKNSWQRYALNEEQQSLMINNKSILIMIYRIN